MSQPVADPAEDANRSSTRERLEALLGDRRRTVVALAACSSLSGLAESALLVLLIQIAATAVKGSTHVGGKYQLFSFHARPETLFAIACALTILRTALQVPLAVLPARISADVQARLRNQLFGAFTRASWTVQSSVREGHLQETLTSQVMQATGGALMATTLVVSAFSFIVLMVSAVALNPVAAIAILAAAMVIFAALRPFNRLGHRRAKELSRAQLDYAAGVNEASRLAEETQVFGVGEAERAHIGGLIETARGLFYRAQLLMRISPSLYQSAIYVILVGGLFALWELDRRGFTSLGGVVLIIVRAGSFGQVVQASYQGLRQALPFVERLQNTIRYYAASTPPEGEQPLSHVTTIAFADVSFSYRAERPVLKEIDFTIAAGEAIGIIGPSGAGKSTMIQLLLRLRPPDSGRYLVNGVAVEEFRHDDWHDRVAYVPQQPRLLHATVAENIRYFREIDDEHVERAGRLARIHEEIMSWPEGYETVVGPRVDAVSGGQQQRICLARALAGRPEMLVLDEPTSALDPHSETLIQESLEGLRNELTLFIIAHRMSTLDICDRVMVIVDGRLVAFDTLAQLGQTNSYYRSASMIATGAIGGTLP